MLADGTGRLKLIFPRTSQTHLHSISISCNQLNMFWEAALALAWQMLMSLSSKNVTVNLVTILLISIIPICFLIRYACNIHFRTGLREYNCFQSIQCHSTINYSQTTEIGQATYSTYSCLNILMQFYIVLEIDIKCQ